MNQLLASAATAAQRYDAPTKRSQSVSPPEEWEVVVVRRQGRWIGAIDHPAELKRRVRYYPNGPLADLYHRGRRGKYLRCRYESIRVSLGISVTDVRYLYEEAVQAGSDHALVVADIDLM